MAFNAVHMSVWSLLSLLVMVLAVAVAAQNTTSFDARRTLSIGIVVFPGWEPLDVFGPLQLFTSLSYSHKMTLSIIAHQTGPVTTLPPAHLMEPGMPPMEVGFMINVPIVATHTFANAPALDVLLVPGGLGNVALEQKGDTAVEDFVARRFDAADYVLSVCTGAASLAKAGVLSGRRATTNKGAWDWVTGHGTNISWVPTARWVEDGKVWTSSGVTAGIDMTYAFLKHLYGDDDAGLIRVMGTIEYAPHTDPSWDPFSIVHKVPGANTNGSLESCVRPVGY